MHPELQLLEQRYRSLVEEVNAGHVTAEDAMVTLSGMVAVDAAGASWSIDPYTGQFTRALAGGAPVPADASLYAPATSPSMGGAPADMFAPPTPGGYLPPATESWEAPGAGPVGRPVPAGASPSRFSGLTSGLAGLTRGRGRVLAVVGAGVLAVLALAMFRPSPQSAAPEDASSASASASPEASASPSASASATPTAPSKLPVPDQARRDALVRTLTSGVRADILKQIDPAANTTRVLLSTAPLSGVVRLGFLAKAGETTSSESGQASMKVVVSSASGPLQTYVVPLVRVNNAWLIGSSVSAVK